MNLPQIIEKMFGYNVDSGSFTNLTQFFDVIFGLFFFILLLTFLIRHTKNRGIITILILSSIGCAIAFAFDLNFLLFTMFIILFGFAAMIIINCAPEYRLKLGGTKGNFDRRRFLASEEEKDNLIEILIHTVDFLSSRKTGAIITIERENSLNLWIDKGVKLNSMVTFELLTTIFYNGTALHDGAVIIRGNEIACAASVYPLSENVDVPKQYGTRHRAGLGISEITDSFTIVVSEETGRVATMAGGVINPDVSLESLRETLDQMIIVK